MPVDNQNDRGRSPTGPWVAPPTGPWSAPPRAPASPPQAPASPPRAPVRRIENGGLWLLVLQMAVVSIFAFKELSQPGAWAYWRDQYVSPSLSAQRIANADFIGASRGRPALAIRGTIGPAAASWLRQQLDQALLAPGDLVLLSSPGGDLQQAAIMGEIIRSHGLATAVGTADETGHVRPSYCASACVLVYAGGKPRYGVEGWQLGVHRFFTTGQVDDPVADTQRTAGLVLGYFTKMGVSSTVVEAMSQTREVRWLEPKEALAMNLITDPVGRP